MMDTFMQNSNVKLAIIDMVLKRLPKVNDAWVEVNPLTREHSILLRLLS